MPDEYLENTPLTEDEVNIFVALQRVSGGDVAELHGRYFHRGRPMVSWLEGPLTDLVQAGLIELGDPESTTCPLRRAVLTASGRARHGTLCDKQGFPRPGSYDDAPHTCV